MLIDDTENIHGQIEANDIIDFASGLFAAFLLILSVIAYRNVKTRKLLYVSIAFALFSLTTLIARLDFFIPEAESTNIEVAVALTKFAILALFFIAIVKR